MSLLQVKNLTKIYTSDEGMETPALQGVSFDIKKGEFVAIMGPSGSGKSTLLHLIGFLDRQTKGTYRFDGKTIDDLSEDEVAKLRNRKMGFVFQMFNLLPRTSVLENVKLPLVYSKVKEKEWDGVAMGAIDAVGLSHRSHHQPSQLSGGEKQRVAIARALVNGPQVIFADEPTGNLDSKSGLKIMHFLQDLNERHGHTIILITHETYTAEHAQRIIRLMDGKIESDKKVSNQKHAKGEKFLK
ncbi:ABC transporter ATP-binding protein [Patescibacteria group bacterium]|nr:ABC transporter ATP-binding protein [Patescibacteria group bacterium]